MVSQNIEVLKSKGCGLNNDEFMELIMYQVAQGLLASMRSDEVILLSTLYNSYVSELRTKSENYPSIVNTEIRTPTRCWVLSRLHSLFGDLLTIVCKHDKYGTLLFHSKCNLV